MSKIFDNSSNEKKFKSILENVITEPGIQRMDFCVGYFNLRGWNFIADQVDNHMKKAIVNSVLHAY